MVLGASLGTKLGKVLGGTDGKSLGKVLGALLGASVGTLVTHVVITDPPAPILVSYSPAMMALSIVLFAAVVSHEPTTPSSIILIKKL